MDFTEFELSRAELRRHLLPQIVYLPVAEAPARGLGGGGRQYLSAVTLTAGLDFPINATHWHNLEETSRDVVATWLNGLAHLDAAMGKQPTANMAPLTEDGRRGRGAAAVAAAAGASGLPRFGVTIYVETLLTPVSQATGRVRAAAALMPNKARVAGYRLWAALEQRAEAAPPPAAAVAEAAAPPRDRLDEDEAEEEEAAPAAPTPARRKPASQVLQEQARARLLDAPLAHGMALSALEAVELEKKVLAAAKRGRKGAAAVLTDKDKPSTYTAYRYAAFTNVDLFYSGPLLGYFQAEKPQQRPTDRRPFWQYNAGTLVAANNKLSRDYPLCPDVLLSKESAMVYHIVGASLPVAPAQCRLASYVPGADALPQAGGGGGLLDMEAEEASASSEEEPSTESLLHSSDLEERVDAMEIDPPEPRLPPVTPIRTRDRRQEDDADGEGPEALTNAMAAAEQHVVRPAERAQNTMTLDTLLDARTGRPRYPDTSRLQWPEPHVTYILHLHARMPELLLGLMPLPQPVGSIVATATREGQGWPAHRYEQQLLRQTYELRRLERQQPGGHRPTAAPTVQLHTVEQTVPGGRHGINGGQMLPRISGVSLPEVTLAQLTLNNATAAELAPVAPALLAQVRDEQVNVVTRTIVTLGTTYQRAQYEEFLQQARPIPPPTSHEHMPRDEFRPHRSGLYGASDAALQRSLAKEFQSYFAEQRADDDEPTAAGSEDAMARDLKAQMAIADKIDVFAAWQVERNEMLEMRKTHQLSREALNYRQKRELERLRARFAAEQEDDADWFDHEDVIDDEEEEGPQSEARARYEVAKRELQSQHRGANFHLQTRMWRAFDERFRTAEAMSSSWLETRRYCVDHVMKTGQYADVSKVRLSMVDGRGYARYMQWLTDSFMVVDQVSEQNIPYLERAYVCAFHAHRWEPRRSDPALNYMCAGKHGAGKSYILLRVSYMAPPGVAQNVSVATQASFNVDQDFDNCAYIHEEMDSGYLFSAQPGGGKKDTGASDKTNFFKARTTSFATVTQFFVYDEDTHERKAKKCYSSQHNVTLAATNQNLDGMDPNVRSRLLIDYVVENVVDSDGGKPGDVAKSTIFTHSDHTREMQVIHRELHCAFFYVETAIKAGVIDEVLIDGGRIMLDTILQSAALVEKVNMGSMRQRNWILEAARTLTILHACWTALFTFVPMMLYASPDEAAAARLEAAEPAVPRDALRPATAEQVAAAMHTSDEEPEPAAARSQSVDPDPLAIVRWSPAMFQRIVAPNLVIKKEQMIHALTLFDFLFCSRDEENLLRTLALELCHVDDPALRQYRQHTVASQHERNGVLQKDYNFVAVSGTNAKRLCDRLVDLNKRHAQLRSEDAQTLLGPYEKMYKTSPDFVPLVFDPNDASVVRQFTRGPAEQAQSRSAIFFEADPAATSRNNYARQLCVSIDFLQNHFKFDINESAAAIRAKIEAPVVPIDARRFEAAPTSASDMLDAAVEHEGWAAAVALGQCADTRSPLVAAIRRILSNPTLERSPYEHPVLMPVPAAALRYSTAYKPDFGVLRIASDLPDVRVPLHGSRLVLTLERNTEAACLARNNYDRPLPTAQRSIFGITNVAALPHMDQARGFMARDYDLDFTMMVVQMDRLGDPGFGKLEEMLVQTVLAEQAPGADAMHDDEAEAERRAALLAALPPMRGAPRADIPEAASALINPVPWLFEPLLYRLENALYERSGAAAGFAPYPALNIYTRMHDTAMRELTRVEKRRNNRVYASYETLTGVHKRRYATALPPAHLLNLQPAQKRQRLGTIDEEDS